MTALNYDEKTLTSFNKERTNFFKTSPSRGIFCLKKRPRRTHNGGSAWPRPGGRPKSLCEDRSAAMWPVMRRRVGAVPNVEHVTRLDIDRHLDGVGAVLKTASLVVADPVVWCHTPAAEERQVVSLGDVDSCEVANVARDALTASDGELLDRRAGAHRPEGHELLSGNRKTVHASQDELHAPVIVEVDDRYQLVIEEPVPHVAVAALGRDVTERSEAELDVVNLIIASETPVAAEPVVDVVPEIRVVTIKIGLPLLRCLHAGEDSEGLVEAQEGLRYGFDIVDDVHILVAEEVPAGPNEEHDCNQTNQTYDAIAILQGSLLMCTPLKMHVVVLQFSLNLRKEQALARSKGERITEYYKRCLKICQGQFSTEISIPTFFKKILSISSKKSPRRRFFDRMKNMNREVNDYIKKQKSPQKEICQKVRKVIIKTFPNIKEKMWVGVPWYEGKYYIAALKDHVNLGFAIKGLSKKELNLFEGKGKTMRHIKIYSLEDINEKQIIKLLKVAKKAICSC